MKFQFSKMRFDPNIKKKIFKNLKKLLKYIFNFFFQILFEESMTND